MAFLLARMDFAIRAFCFSPEVHGSLLLSTIWTRRSRFKAGGKPRIGLKMAHFY
jgi:hypothetical protein